MAMVMASSGLTFTTKVAPYSSWSLSESSVLKNQIQRKIMNTMLRSMIIGVNKKLKKSKDKMVGLSFKNSSEEEDQKFAESLIF